MQNPFLKNSESSISLDQQSKVYSVCFYSIFACQSQRLSKCVESADHLLLPHIKVFLKKKEKKDSRN